jgi:mono/diheme cytochrome c family protein
MRNQTPVSSDTSSTSDIHRGQDGGVRRLGWVAGLCAMVILAGAVGCGTNADQVLTHAGNAAVFTMLDRLLTNVANSVATTREQFEPPADVDEPSGDDSGDGGGDGGDGAAIYADNCASCHGEDGNSGFAPPVAGLDVEQMTAGLGSAAHGSLALSDADVAAITEFLGGDVGGGGDDGGDGGAIYADSCASCHGEDGNSGFAPPIAGLDVEQMTAGLGSAAHGSLALSDADVAAITEFLGG